MVGFVLGSQSLEHVHGYFSIRLLYQNRLEPALQRRILLNISAVLVLGSGSQALKLAPGKGRFHQVGGVDSPFGSACADQGMYLVNEQDYLALSLFDLVHHGL